MLEIYQSDNDILFFLRQRIHQMDQTVAMALFTSSTGWMGR